MSLFELHSCSISIRYKNTFCSKATFFVLICTLIAIIFPLILSYRTRGLWLKNYTFYEQPAVRFKYQYLFILETEDPDCDISCGNLRNITNSLLDDCFHIKVRESDYNLDKKIEELSIEVHLNNVLQKSITSIKMILVIDYILDETCPLQMESIIFHEQHFGTPIAKYFISGNLKWIQIAPLPCLYNYKDIRYNYSIPIEEENSLQNMIYAYSKRNVSTSLGNLHSIATRGISPINKIEISITIPEHAIGYKPGLWQELKFGWQQYFSIAIIFYWILIKIKGYVFNNGLLPAWRKDPLKDEPN